MLVSQINVPILPVDHGDEGKLATIHVMVTALASLHKRCLVMENTARGKMFTRLLYKMYILYRMYFVMLLCYLRLLTKCLSYHLKAEVKEIN